MAIKPQQENDLCAAAILFVRRTLLLCRTSFKPLAACHSPQSLWVKNTTGLGCSGVKYERQDSCKTSFCFFLFFLLDKTRSCWFVHAYRGSRSPTLSVQLLKLGKPERARDCWLASLARFFLNFFLSPEHIRYQYGDISTENKTAAHLIEKKQLHQQVFPSM